MTHLLDVSETECHSSQRYSSDFCQSSRTFPLTVTPPWPSLLTGHSPCWNSLTDTVTPPWPVTGDMAQPHRHCDPLPDPQLLTRHSPSPAQEQPHRHCDPLPDPQLLTRHSPSPAQEQPHRHCDPLPDPSLLTRHSPCRNSLTDTNCKHKRHQLWPLPWPPTNCDPLPDPPLTMTPSLTLH